MLLQSRPTRVLHPIYVPQEHTQYHKNKNKRPQVVVVAHEGNYYCGSCFKERFPDIILRARTVA